MKRVYLLLGLSTAGICAAGFFGAFDSRAPRAELSQTAPVEEEPADARWRPSPSPPKPSFTDEVAPLLTKHCLPCHDAKTARGNVNLAALTEKLDLREAIHVGHSTGGGEVARYIGRHGTKRVAKAVLIGAVPPLMLKTAANPGGLPIEAFDAIRAGVLADRSQFFKDLTTPFYGANRPGAKVSQGLRDSFWLQGMLAGFKGALDCIKAFSETDFTQDLARFDVPTLILHGDDDQIVPIGASAMRSAQLIKGSTLKVYPGLPHGMCSTHKDQINADLLAFIKG